MSIADLDIKQGIFTLLTPDEAGYVIAKDAEGVPVALYFSSEQRAEAYKRDIGQQEARVLFLRGAKEVEELTQELVDAGVKEAFVDHAKGVREAEVLDLAAWARRLKPKKSRQ